jgi:hypothetical protein
MDEALDKIPVPGCPHHPRVDGPVVKFNFKLCHFFRGTVQKVLLDGTVPSTKFFLDGTVPATILYLLFILVLLIGGLSSTREARASIEKGKSVAQSVTPSVSQSVI